MLHSTGAHVVSQECFDQTTWWVRGGSSMRQQHLAVRSYMYRVCVYDRLENPVEVA